MSFSANKYKYDAFIRVTRAPFSDFYYISASALEPDEAIRLCKEAAKGEGWRPPSWWQWWRSKDSSEPFVLPSTGL